MEKQSEINKTLTNVRSIQNYSTKVVKILSDKGIIYGKGAVRLVACGGWQNDAIYAAMLALLNSEVEQTKKTATLAKQINKAFEGLK